MYYGMTIGERLKKLREDKGEKQQDVANAILVDRTVISFFERNERKPDVDKLIALAKHFDVTTDFLLCCSDVKKTDTTLQAVSKYIGLSDEAIKNIKLVDKKLDAIGLLDTFICSSTFLNMMIAFDDAAASMRNSYREIEDLELEIEKTKKEMEELKKDGYDDDELENYYNEIELTKEEIEIFKEEIEDSIDICTAKTIRVARNFFKQE